MRVIDFLLSILLVLIFIISHLMADANGQGSVIISRCERYGGRCHSIALLLSVYIRFTYIIDQCVVPFVY